MNNIVENLHNTWDSASVVTATAPFTASTPGSTECLTAPISYSGSIAYFALKSRNTHGEWSALSNNGFWSHFDVYLPLVLRQLEG